MAKTKTSKKQKKVYPSPWEVMKPVKIKNPEQFPLVNATQWMADKKNIIPAIVECLRDGDLESLKEIIKGHYQAKHYLSVPMNRRTFDHAMSEKGNPSAKHLMAILSDVLA